MLQLSNSVSAKIDSQINIMKDAISDTPIVDLIKYNLKIINPDDEVIGIFITGSLSTGLNDDNSDIDIAVFTTKTYQYAADYYAKYKNHSVHWWYIPPYFTWAGYIQPNDIKYNKIMQCGVSTYASLTLNNFIYINPKYKEIINMFLENKYNYTKWGISALYETLNSENILELNPIRMNQKFMSFFCYCYYVFNDIELDTELLIRLKRRKLTEEDFPIIKNAVTNVVNYIKSDNNHWTIEWSTLSSLIYNKVKEIKLNG